MNPGQVYIRHYHSDLLEHYDGRCFTVAVQRDSFGLVYMGIAICSPKDQFCKRTGRLLAIARLTDVFCNEKASCTTWNKSLTMDGHIYAVLITSELPLWLRTKILDTCEIESLSGFWRIENV